MMQTRPRFTFRRAPFAVALAAAGWVVLACWTAEARAQAEEQTLVAEQFGRAIRAARTSPDPGDNLLVAQRMLAHAARDDTLTMHRFVLAIEALDLVIDQGTPATTKLALQALRLADGTRPLPTVQFTRLDMNIRAAALAYARRTGAPPAKLVELAESAIGARLAHAKALMNLEKDFDATAEHLRVARALARTYRRGELEARGLELQQRLRVRQARQNAFRAARQELLEARQAGDPERIAAAERAMATAYIDYDGDVLAAEPYLADSNDPLARAASIAARHHDQPADVTAAECLDAAEQLTARAQRLDPPADKALATVARGLCESALAGQLPGDSNARAEKLHHELLVLLEDTPAQRAEKLLAESYDMSAATVEQADHGQIRIRYDFTNQAELADFQTQGGQWDVGKGVLACKTALRETGYAWLPVRLRLVQPFRVSILGRARGSLGLGLSCIEPTEARRLGRKLVRKQERFWVNGADMFHHGWLTGPFSEYNKLPRGAKSLRFDVLHDGKRNLTWSINGKVVHQAQIAPERLSDPNTWFQPIVWTEGADNVFTAFDYIEVRGTIITPDPEPVSTGADDGQTDTSDQPADDGQPEGDAARSQPGGPDGDADRPVNPGDAARDPANRDGNADREGNAHREGDSGGGDAGPEGDAGEDDANWEGDAGQGDAGREGDAGGDQEDDTGVPPPVPAPRREPDRPRPPRPPNLPTP